MKTKKRFRELALKCGLKVTPVNVTMRSCQDVPRFLKKLDRIQKLSAKSTLRFGLLVLLALLCAVAASAANLFKRVRLHKPHGIQADWVVIATNGSPSASGTMVSPLDWNTAWALAAGYRIYPKNGTYTQPSPDMTVSGNDEPAATGTNGQPVWGFFTVGQ